MRQFTAALMALVALTSLLTGCGSEVHPAPSAAVTATPTPEPIALWVAPNGNDSASGTAEAPFLTIERAKLAVRALPASAWTTDVAVNLREGTYRLTSPLVLDGDDSGRNGHRVTYRSAPGERAVLTGAMRVSEWQLSDASLGIYRAYVGPVETRQVYVNGTRATRARTSDYPAGFLPFFYWNNQTPTEVGIEYIPTTLNPSTWRDPSLWKNPQDVEAVIVTQWKMMRVKIASVVPSPQYQTSFLLQPFLLGAKTGLLVMQDPAWRNANVFVSADTHQPGPWSFWQVTRFENAYAFLDVPGEWYLDRGTGYLYYKPRPGEDLRTADVELAALETLVQGRGTAASPLRNLRFEGLTFTGATWLQPSGNEGYVSDQSGCCLIGPTHQPTVSGHDKDTRPTPGNVTFTYSQNVVFEGNVFTHLGAVGLDFSTGCKHNRVQGNLFADISSAAIQIGGVSLRDAHPASNDDIVSDTLISGNLVRDPGQDYSDAAGIMVGFSRQTTIANNTVVNTPWSGLAMGWGWGLLDPGMYPGLPNAQSGDWGTYSTPTPNSQNRVVNNLFYSFTNILWDGGAIYTTGQQGESMADALQVSGNVATNKRPSAGSNAFYTDGGSRYVALAGNVSYNQTGVYWFGPLPQANDPLPYTPLYELVNCVPYGSDTGGCRTYGDITYTDNYWQNQTFFIADPCEYEADGVSYPTRLQYDGNHVITGLGDVPQPLLQAAGVQTRPSTIPASLWVLPPDGDAPQQTPVTCP